VKRLAENDGSIEERRNIESSCSEPMIADLRIYKQACRINSSLLTLEPMSRLPLGRIYFPLAYILLAIGFLTIHYTREKHFSALVDGIEIRGKSTVGTIFSSPKIRKLTVNAAGLELLFSKLNTAALTTEDEIRHRLVINGWSKDENSVNIILSDDVGIKISSNAYDRALNLSTIIPATIPPVKFAEFPLQPANSADVKFLQNNTLAIKLDDIEYVVTLPPNSLWDPKLRRLIVNAEINPTLELPDIQ